MRPEGVSDNPLVECAVFPGKLVFINNGEESAVASCRLNKKEYKVELTAYGLCEVEI